MIKASKQHLKNSNESYLKHMIWATMSGLRLILGGLVSIVHGFVPALFQAYTAKLVIKLYYTRLDNHPNKEYQDYIELSKSKKQ
jgi:hypothetical protein